MKKKLKQPRKKYLALAKKKRKFWEWESETFLFGFPWNENSFIKSKLSRYKYNWSEYYKRAFLSHLLLPDIVNFPLHPIIEYQQKKIIYIEYW